jgi:FkbM family methyltransferase
MRAAIAERASSSTGETTLPLSYTQNLEDYHLAQALGDRESGFYIDVGAGHPVADNVSFWFYERGWSGIVVEPQAQLAAQYRYVRPRDICVSSLVGSAAGEAEFYVFDRLHGLSTTVASYAQGGAKFGDDYRVERTPVTTLAALCEQHSVGEIDFLKIDVEGAEGDVLAGNDWRRYRPKIVVAEAILLEDGRPTWESWEPFLIDQGYEFTLFDTLNRFYVATEQHAILRAMPRERAPWDAATHMYEIGKAPENAMHPDHDLAVELTRAFWASLPRLDSALLAELLRSTRKLSAAENESLQREVQTDRFKTSLARIACGYDGGQIDPE